MTIAIVKVADGIARVVPGENTAAAAAYAREATLAANSASAAGNYFPSQAAGEAGTAVEGFFSHPDGAGGLVYRERTGGGSTILGYGATKAQVDAKVATADLASDTGFALIKHKRAEAGTYARTARQLDAIGALATGGLSVMHFVDPDYDDEILAGTHGAINLRDSVQNALDQAVGKRLEIPHQLSIGSNVNVPLGVVEIVGLNGGGYKAIAPCSFVLDPNITGLSLLDFVVDRNGQAGTGVLGFNPAGNTFHRIRVTGSSMGDGFVLRAYGAAQGGAQDVRDNDIDEIYVECVGAHLLAVQSGFALDGEIPVNTAPTPDVTYDALATWTHDESDADQGAAVGSLLVPEFYARKNRVGRVCVVGGKYAFGFYFAQDNQFGTLIARDAGGGVAAPTGPVRGVSLQSNSSRNQFGVLRLVNTQSSALHANYGSEANQFALVDIYNEITDYGLAAPGSTVNGSQALVQFQAGCPRNKIGQLKVDVVTALGNAGPQSFINIGPNSSGCEILDMDLRGKAAVVGISVESTYDSASAPATGYAYDGGVGTAFAGADWATADLDGVRLAGAMHLENAVPALQIVQGLGFGVTNIDEQVTVTGAYSARTAVDRGTGALSGRFNWGNATPVEFGNTTEPSVFGATLFKQYTGGYKDIEQFKDWTPGQEFTVQGGGTGVFAASSLIGTPNNANFTTGNFNADSYFHFIVNAAGKAILTSIGGAVAAPAYAAAAPTKAEFDAVIDKLKSAGVFR